MLVVGVDKIIKSFVDLRVGEVGGGHNHDMSSIGDKVCNGLVGFSCVPFSCTEFG